MICILCYRNKNNSRVIVTLIPNTYMVIEFNLFVVLIIIQNILKEYTKQVIKIIPHFTFIAYKVIKFLYIQNQYFILCYN